MTVLHLDWESRGVVDLRLVGLHRYARDKDTDLWLGAYAFGEEEPQVWYPGQPCPARIVEHVSAGGEVHAWNAPFEIEMWQQIATPRHGWPSLAPEQCFCVMARSYAMGLPGALEDAALAVGLQILKDGEGRNLMLRMSRPRSANPLTWWSDTDKIARLAAYSQQDVRVERELHKRLLPLSDKERKVWLMDYRINQRGVQVDLPSAKAAITLADAMKAQSVQQITELTSGAVQAVTALPALKEWMAGKGVQVDSLAKQALQDLLDGDMLTPRVAKVLKLRQEHGKASTAKFDVMVNRAGTDGRLRQMYQYHGAATGRWTGRGVQPANLPRDMPKAEAVESIMALIRAGEHDAIDAIYGPPLTMASKCLRSFFVAPPGKVLISGDWSNIEGRGVAWFSGEQWKLDAFRAADEGRGPGIYELAYSRMFGVPVESVKDPSEERQVGKVCELAFGYEGGVGSLHTMGKTYGVKVSDIKANEFKNLWRAAHPRVKGTWKQIRTAAINAVRRPGETYECGYPGRTAKFKMVGSFLWLLLPSGRALCYPYPKILESDMGPALTYMTVPGQDKSKIIADAKNAPNWARVGAYGGSLMNNIVQGFSRDILVDCMLPLDEQGAAIVLHTYDDVNIEVDEAKAEGARKALEGMMRAAPAWALGLPLMARPKIMRRYGK